MTIGRGITKRWGYAKNPAETEKKRPEKKRKKTRSMISWKPCEECVSRWRDSHLNQILLRRKKIKIKNED